MIVGGFGYGVRLCVSLLEFLLFHAFIAFIDPAIDRRIIYNDFRSNPYLHFDAGLVPRTLGVQLGEFTCLFVCLLLFTCYALFTLYCMTLLIDYTY